MDEQEILKATDSEKNNGPFIFPATVHSSRCQKINDVDKNPVKISDFSLFVHHFFETGFLCFFNHFWDRVSNRAKPQIIKKTLFSSCRMHSVFFALDQFSMILYRKITSFSHHFFINFHNSLRSAHARRPSVFSPAKSLLHQTLETPHVAPTRC